jgi:hypothetical protein
MKRLPGTFRIVFFLSIVFVLLTASVAGGVIAGETMSYWVQETVHNNSDDKPHNLESKHSNNGHLDNRILAAMLLLSLIPAYRLSKKRQFYEPWLSLANFLGMYFMFSV